MGAGLVVGLDDSHHDVTAAAARLASSVSIAMPSGGAVAGAVSATVQSVASNQPAGTSVQHGDTFIINTTDPFVSAAEVLRKKRSASRSLQR